ncbi:hypothetical protein EJP81_04710 [Rahnella aquatilis]|jgi:hypothetical protein|uniref:hypothetical protein n=1 Tax=Rahnella TaxID=34037 RepID=UPI000649205F|nr:MULTISPECIES: hypothetical protein [Rahnella]AZP41178.1 hypothetical protein EJP79_04705 [Rahnella aquatilis]AZP45519.1 hypothetical protein EJP81_04710 [Rahnella aquatilis]TCQ85176.1 hypothetical protein EC840_11093 [Rahnella sp. JUb53]UJD88221.1 hypothetical protein FS594_05185 [Rahnella aquatilis]
MVNTHDLIAQAIREKKQITAYYQDYFREMCPHALGTKKGKPQALFYQFGGESSKGQVFPGSDTNWRCIPIEGLVGVTIREGEWYTANNHSRAQTCIDYIEVEVSI